ncbi:phosphoribosylanthranilate isomerase [bacterium]|nr:phosphoribosylanthranilate isomerase [bacterium]
MTRVKICGLTNEADVHLAVAEGAHAVGFVHVPASKRFVDADRLASLCRAAGPMTTRVAVIADLALDEAAALAETCALDALQLHGSEGTSYLAALRGRLRPGVSLYKALKVEGSEAIAEAHAFAPLVDALVLDSGGGTGQAFDWSLVEGLSTETALVVAGGLHPGNVGEVIQRLAPHGVDVSSGVEAAVGRKDPERLRAFFAEVRAADAFAPRRARV